MIMCLLADCPEEVFVCKQQIYLLKFSLQQFPSCVASLNFSLPRPIVHFYLFMMVLLRLVFGFAKSVIELCDMNNLLLFSRAENFLFLSRPSTFVFISFSASAFLRRHKMCCVCCIRFERASQQFLPISFRFRT